MTWSITVHIIFWNESLTKVRSLPWAGQGVRDGEHLKNEGPFCVPMQCGLMTLNTCAYIWKQKHEVAVRIKSVDHMSDSLEVIWLSLGRHYHGVIVELDLGGHDKNPYTLGQIPGQGPALWTSEFTSLLGLLTGHGWGVTYRSSIDPKVATSPKSILAWMTTLPQSYRWSPHFD